MWSVTLSPAWRAERRFRTWATPTDAERVRLSSRATRPNIAASEGSITSLEWLAPADSVVRSPLNVHSPESAHASAS